MMFVSYNLVFVSCKAKLESFREPFWLLRSLDSAMKMNSSVPVEEKMRFTKKLKNPSRELHSPIKPGEQRSGVKEGIHRRDSVSREFNHD